MEGMAADESLHIEVIGDSKLASTLRYEMDLSEMDAVAQIPSFIGSVKRSVPATEEQNETKTSLKNKVVFRIVGGSTNMDDWTPERKEFYYGKIDRFFDDMLALYTHPSKIAIVVELQPDLFF
ncbi:MAG: hypothetical protein HQK77_17140 [Desulfobacterales bacterium]|nr:hypothetical protein [Desulfobacterales bacterium]